MSFIYLSQVMDPAFRGAFGNVNRWFTTVVNQPNAKVRELLLFDLITSRA